MPGDGALELGGDDDVVVPEARHHRGGVVADDHEQVAARGAQGVGARDDRSRSLFDRDVGFGGALFLGPGAAREQEEGEQQGVGAHGVSSEWVCASARP